VSDDAFAATVTSGPDAGSVRAPAELGRYRILRELGAGAMGIVVEARDSELERRVALKLLKPGRSDDAKAHLLREARAMASLPHDHVVTVYDVGTIDGQDYVAMELVDGGTLASWLATRPPAAEIIDAFVQGGAWPRSRACRRDRASRLQAAQRAAHGSGRDQGLRFRARAAGARRGRRARRQRGRPDAHGDGLAARNAGVHGTRAVGWRRGRARRRSVRVLRVAVGGIRRSISRRSMWPSTKPRTS
jgi:hypothetical protein